MPFPAACAYMLFCTIFNNLLLSNLCALRVNCCLSVKVIDTAQLLDTLSRECPKLKYLSLLGNVACPNELLGSGHDDEDYQRYR